MPRAAKGEVARASKAIREASQTLELPRALASVTITEVREELWSSSRELLASASETVDSVSNYGAALQGLASAALGSASSLMQEAYLEAGAAVHSAAQTAEALSPSTLLAAQGILDGAVEHVGSTVSWLSSIARGIAEEEMGSALNRLANSVHDLLDAVRDAGEAGGGEEEVKKRTEEYIEEMRAKYLMEAAEKVKEGLDGMAEAFRAYQRFWEKYDWSKLVEALRPYLTIEPEDAVELYKRFVEAVVKGLMGT